MLITRICYCSCWSVHDLENNLCEVDLHTCTDSATGQRKPWREREREREFFFFFYQAAFEKKPFILICCWQKKKKKKKKNKQETETYCNQGSSWWSQLKQHSQLKTIPGSATVCWKPCKFLSQPNAAVQKHPDT